MIAVNNGLVHRYAVDSLIKIRKYMHMHELFIKVQGTGARKGKYTVRYIL